MSDNPNFETDEYRQSVRNSPDGRRALIQAATWSAVREMGAASLLVPLSAKVTRAIRKELNSSERIEFDKGVQRAAKFLNGGGN